MLPLVEFEVTKVRMNKKKFEFLATYHSIIWVMQIETSGILMAINAQTEDNAVVYCYEIKRSNF